MTIFRYVCMIAASLLAPGLPAATVSVVVLDAGGVPLGDAVEGLRTGTLPASAVAITIDDGNIIVNTGDITPGSESNGARGVLPG